MYVQARFVVPEPPCFSVSWSPFSSRAPGHCLPMPPIVVCCNLIMQNSSVIKQHFKFHFPFVFKDSIPSARGQRSSREQPDMLVVHGHLRQKSDPGTEVSQDSDVDRGRLKTDLISGIIKILMLSRHVMSLLHYAEISLLFFLSFFFLLPFICSTKGPFILALCCVVVAHCNHCTVIAVSLHCR